MFLRSCIMLALLLTADPSAAQPDDVWERLRDLNLYYLYGKIGFISAAAGLGLILGAFLSPALAAFRRLLMFALLALAVFLTVFGPFDAFLPFVALGAFGLAFALGRRLGQKLSKAVEEDVPTSFGTAAWATYGYLDQARMLGTAPAKGFFLGEFAEGGRRAPLVYSGQRHLLTVAPTRSGKGVSAIIPNLLSYPGSAFVIDPKGENALVTAARRAALGQDVFLLDPWDIAASKLKLKGACFNPLDWITADDPDAAENAFLLADALVPGGAQGDARFWDDEARALLTGFILYVATTKSEARQRHLGRVRDILVMDDTELRKIFQAMLNHPHPVVASTAARTATKDEKLRANVFTGAQSHTHFLDSPRIRESLSRTDCRFEDLKEGRVSIYLILPADRLKTFDRWLRLLIQIAVTVNARNLTAKPSMPALFLLDEMASLGRLSTVEQAYGLMAGFGIQLWGIVQDLSQLHAIYGDAWQTFVSNSGVIQYFGSRDKMTAEYFSSLCGVTTVRVVNFASAINYAVGVARSYGSALFGGGGGTTTQSSNENRGETATHSSNESQRQLAYPDELMVLKGDEQIVFIENLDPIRAEKILWFENAEMKTLGVNLEPNAAKRPKPVSRQRPVAAVAPPKPAAPGFGETLAPAARAFTQGAAALAEGGGALARSAAGVVQKFRIRIDWSFHYAVIALVILAPILLYALLRPAAWAGMLGYPQTVDDITRLTAANLNRRATVFWDNATVMRMPSGAQAGNVVGTYSKGTELTVTGIAASNRDIWYYVTLPGGSGFVRSPAILLR